MHIRICRLLPRASAASGAAAYRGALAAALGAAVALAGCGGHGPAGPSLAIEKTTLDVGYVVPGQHAFDTLSVENSGRQPLVVRRVRTSGSLLSAHLSAATIAPGGRAKLELEIAPNTWDPEGAFRDWVFLYSNDADRPLVKLEVRGTVFAPLVWQPKVPGLGPMSRGKPVTLTHVRGKNAGPIGPLRVESMVPFSQARAVRERFGYRIELTVGDDAPLGPLFGLVRVQTYDPALPEFDIPVRGTVVHDLLVEPYRFDLGLVRAGSSVSSSVELLVRSGQSLRVLRVEPHVPATSRVESTRRGRNPVVTLRIPTVPQGWNLDGYVNVFTSDPVQPVVHVPVAGTVWVTDPFAQAVAEGTDHGLYGALRAALFSSENKLPPQQIVATVLGGVHDQRAVTLLLRALHDGNWYVRQRAIDVLGVLRSTSAFDPIRLAVTDDVQSEVRRAAVAALVRIAGKRALPSLVLALQDDDSFVRDDTAALLGHLGDPRVIPALEAAREDPDPGVRQTITKALKELQQR